MIQQPSEFFDVSLFHSIMNHTNLEELICGKAVITDDPPQQATNATEGPPALQEHAALSSEDTAILLEPSSSDANPAAGRLTVLVVSVSCISEPVSLLSLPHLANTMEQSSESPSEHNSIVLCEPEMCVGEFLLNADFHVSAENHSEDWRNTDASSKFNYFIEYLLNRADEGKEEGSNGGEIHIPPIGQGIGACTTLEILQRSPVLTSTCCSSMKVEMLKSFIFWKNLLCWHRWSLKIHIALRPVSDITTESAIFIFLSILSTIRRAFYKKTGGRMREFIVCLLIAIIQSMEGHLVVSALESSLLFIEGLIELFSLDFPPYEATQPIWKHDGVFGYIVQHTMPQLISIASLPAQNARSPSPICIKALEMTERYIIQYCDEILQIGGSDESIRFFGCCDAVEEDFRAGIGQCWFLGLDTGAVA
jgi:hypothetical protein